MNAIQREAAAAFVEILHDAGVAVSIFGKEYRAMVSPNGLAVDLEEGGFTQDGALTVRMLVAHLPFPSPNLNDVILIGDERHKIEQITKKPGAGIIEYRVARR